MAVKFVDGVLRPGGLVLTKRLVDFCDYSAERKVLDIGCGEGTTVQFLVDTYGLDAIGVDLSLPSLEVGRGRCPHLQLMQADGKRLPFSPGEFGGVLAECSLSAMDYAQEVLREINRILVMGGRLGISDLYRKNDRFNSRLLTGSGCLSGTKTYGELKEILTDNGFRIIHWEDHSQYLKEFVARYIMKYGSFADFWPCKLAVNNHCQGNGLKKSDIGYFLLVAEKVQEKGT